MTRVLPEFIVLRRDRKTGLWSMVCKACGTATTPAGVWYASEAAHAHAAEEFQDLDEKRAGA